MLMSCPSEEAGKRDEVEATESGIEMKVELAIEEIHVMSRAEVPPFDVESASRSAKELEEVPPCAIPSLTDIRFSSQDLIISKDVWTLV